jgi:hypothetical protein
MQKILIPLFFVLFLTATGAVAQVIDTNCATYMRRIFYYAEKGAHFIRRISLLHFDRRNPPE